MATVSTLIERLQQNEPSFDLAFVDSLATRLLLVNVPWGINLENLGSEAVEQIQEKAQTHAATTFAGGREDIQDRHHGSVQADIVVVFITRLGQFARAESEKYRSSYKKYYYTSVYNWMNRLHLLTHENWENNQFQTWLSTATAESLLRNLYWWEQKTRGDEFAIRGINIFPSFQPSSPLAPGVSVQVQAILQPIYHHNQDIRRTNRENELQADRIAGMITREIMTGCRRCYQDTGFGEGVFFAECLGKLASGLEHAAGTAPREPRNYGMPWSELCKRVAAFLRILRHMTKGSALIRGETFTLYGDLDLVLRGARDFRAHFNIPRLPQETEASISS